MARRGDALVLRGKTWWLDFTHMGQRHQARLGRNINRTVARELAAVERAKILKGEAGIGGNERKDILFDKAAREFLTWAQANKRLNTVNSYRKHVKQLLKSFSGRYLSQIHPFLVEKHKQKRITDGSPVSFNHELTCLTSIFYKCMDWGKFEGDNPVRKNKVQKLEESKGKLRYLTHDEEARLLAVTREPLRTIILLGINTGLRIKAEALTLRWENVDLK
jgi:integrase